MQFLALTRHLTFWVLLAVALGALLGHFLPETAKQMEPLGKGFIELVKLFIYPLIFLTITLGISAMGSLRQVGQIGGKALLYFEVVTTFALVIGIMVAYALKPGQGVMPPSDASASEKVEKYRNMASDFTWSHFFQDNLTLQVLFVSLACGVILSQMPSKDGILRWLTTVLHAVFFGLRCVMLLAPLGAFGGMAVTVGLYGLASLIPLAKLMFAVYLTMALFIFVVLGALMRHSRVSLLGYLSYVKAELLVVLGTSSSEAALPALMTKLERMGCAKSVVGLVVPAGYSFNLDGTTIYLSMATIFLAQVYNVELGWGQLLTIIGVLMVTSKGAAGVTGAGFTVLASTLSAVKVIPVEGLVLLLGVDRFMSEARAITNFIGNGVATVVLASHEGVLDRDMLARAFASEKLALSTGSDASDPEDKVADDSSSDAEHDLQ